jgi:excisionase family DNA binding protein
MAKPNQREPINGSKFAYTIAELCERVPVGRTLVYDEINQGRLIAHKIGGRTVILPDDAIAWLKASPLFKSARDVDKAKSGRDTDAAPATVECGAQS